MRAYRPGLVGGEECDEEYAEDREEKVRIYAERAQAGLPLFDVILGPVKVSGQHLLNSSSH